MKDLFAVLSRIFIVGWFFLAISLYFKALFNPKHALLTWFITITVIVLYFLIPPQECHVCLDGGYIGDDK